MRVGAPPRPRLRPIGLTPARLNGQPCVRNLRLTVRRVLEALAVYPHRAKHFREYPALEPVDVNQVPAYAAAALYDKEIDPRARETPTWPRFAPHVRGGNLGFGHHR
jgi:uncharacterized protein (DUF433 family)